MSRDRNLDRDSRGWATIRMKFDSQEADLIERAAEISKTPVVLYMYKAILDHSRHLESQ